MDRFKTLATALVILCMFSGCEAFKHRQGAERIQSVAFTSPHSSTFENGEWPAEDWWIIFDDRQLSELMEKVLADNFDLKAAISRVQEVEAQARYQRSPLMPRLSVSAEDQGKHLSSHGLLRTPPSYIPAAVNQIDLSLNFDYEVDLFGKNRKRYQAAIGMLKAQKAEMSQAVLMITTLFAATYFNYQAYLQQLDISQEILATQQQYFDLVYAQKGMGVVEQITVEKAHASLAQAKERVTVFQQEVVITESLLKILMGLSPDDCCDFERIEAVFEGPFALPEDIPADLLARRPDLMAQIWRVEAAAQLVGAAKSNFFPNINLAAMVGLETLSLKTLFSAGSFASAVIPAIHLPLFTGGALKAQLDASYAHFDTTVHDYNHLLLTAVKEVSDHIQTVQLVNQQRHFQSEVVSNLQRATDLTTLRFEQGVDSALAKISSHLDLLQAKLHNVTVQNARYLALVNLIKSLGGGYVSNGAEE